MKTSAQITQEIATAQRELADIERSLPVIYDRGDTAEQQDAEVSLVACQNRVTRLQTRLKEAEEHEKRQAEDDRRQANEDTMTEAQAAHDDARDRFKEKQRALIAHVTAESDELDALRWECQRLQGEYQDAWLRNHPEQRHDSFTWPKLGSLALDNLTEPEGHAQDALGVLFSSRHGLPGNLNDLRIAAAGQASAQWRAIHQAQQAEQAARPPELTRAQEVDLIGSEIRAKVLAGLDDRMSSAR